MNRLLSRLVTYPTYALNPAAGKANKQSSDFVTVASLLFPYIDGRFNFNTLSLIFFSGVLAGKGGVFEFHDLGINLLEFLLGCIRRTHNLGCDGRKFASIDESVDIFRPIFAF